jgi:hypothetical protein
MTEGRMPKVVCETGGLDNIRKLVGQLYAGGHPGILLDHSRNGASDLGALKRVGDAGSEEITHTNTHNLTLSLQSAERARVNDPVTILSDRRSGITRFL